MGVFHIILQVFSTTFLIITLGVFSFLTCHSETIAFTGQTFTILDNSEIFELKICLFVEVIMKSYEHNFIHFFNLILCKIQNGSIFVTDFITRAWFKNLFGLE